jgi:predicted Zn-ribbon and HTH transcriptional regulator
MAGLDPAERLELVRQFPELRFAVRKDGARKRILDSGEFVDDPKAGFVEADRLEHVRRLSRRDSAADVADAAIARSCEHDFRKNSIGDNTTCWKCGHPGPKAEQPAPDADAEHAEYLRKVAAQQAAYEAEKALQAWNRDTGGTDGAA